MLKKERGSHAFEDVLMLSARALKGNRKINFIEVSLLAGGEEITCIVFETDAGVKIFLVNGDFSLVPIMEEEKTAQVCLKYKKNKPPNRWFKGGASSVYTIDEVLSIVRRNG